MELIQNPWAQLGAFVLIIAVAVILFFVWRNNKKDVQAIIDQLTGKKSLAQAKVVDASAQAAGISAKLEVPAQPATAEQVQTEIKEAEDEGAKLKEAMGSLITAHTERKKARIHEKSASKASGGPRLA
jgi:hypothetical protein